MVQVYCYIACRQLSRDIGMECPDSPATMALLQASIKAESVREKSDKPYSWHSTVEDMFHIPEIGTAFSPHSLDPPRPEEAMHVKQNRPKNRTSLEPDQAYNRHRNPIKTVPPRKAIMVNNTSLKKRIDSLQSLVLVERWHFPEMSDEKMRTWLAEKWIPYIGYVPIISRLMKDWYSFHFQKSSDLEFII